MNVKRHRNPRFPKCTLEQAISLISIIYEDIERARVQAEVLAKAIGYKGLSGASQTALASLSSYGLLEREGQRHSVSSLALRIIRETSDSDKREALMQALVNPKLFNMIHTDFAHLNETTLANTLISEMRMNDSGAKKAAQTYKKSLAYIEDQFPNGRTEEAENGSETSDQPEDDDPIRFDTSSVQKQPKNEQKPQGKPMNTQSDSVVLNIRNQSILIPLGLSESEYNLLTHTLKQLKSFIVKGETETESDSDEDRPHHS